MKREHRETDAQIRAEPLGKGVVLVNGHKGQRIGGAWRLTVRKICLEEQLKMEYLNNVRSKIGMG